MAELLFGVGVPASAAPGADPVALAREAERLGFDFVSLPDHPCGPDPSYEATVLMTWIAARTSRIKVASRVLAVPFRRPALLAKLAASLDLLSGGRLILGLGGGYSDSEITALGGPALSPAEKVDGLAEAIQVIRGAWTQPGYSQDGRHHSVRDLEMEPRPGRPIPVWTGVFGPRALAVTGRLADGWIPSLGYMPAEDIPAMRHRIDAAAEAAGRHPRDIRGILNLGIRIDPAPACTGAELLAIAEVRHLLGRRSESAFLAEVARDWGRLFPVLPCHSEVNRRTRWLWGAFEQLRSTLAARLPENDCQQVCTSALPVKHPSRVRRADQWTGPGNPDLRACARAVDKATV